MSGYFVTEGSKFKGRPLTTLPVVLNRDLSRIINSNLQLKSSHDLEHLRHIAQQRDEWTKLTEKQPRRPSRSTEMRKALMFVYHTCLDVYLSLCLYYHQFLFFSATPIASCVSEYKLAKDSGVSHASTTELMCRPGVFRILETPIA
ncbi:hypothetical protein ElyMa_005586900 [Elysia marginata]|uniref:Uncharacterized protein n=1 Tax=Elysia marginata TaxID=1093978 RepID=A0AAV4F4E5_9GAST|nr:hypothetical protein ElyMa_005586900 [Elysia marginata]